jgi:hypothetical protein
MYAEYADPSHAAPPLLRRMTAAGLLSRKTGTASTTTATSRAREHSDSERAITAEKVPGLTFASAAAKCLASDTAMTVLAAARSVGCQRPLGNPVGRPRFVHVAGRSARALCKSSFLIMIARFVTISS